MRKSILMLFAFVALSTTAFAQEDDSSRSLYFYLDGNSGNLVGEDFMAGPWACAGLGYEHSFSNGFGFVVGAVVFDEGDDEISGAGNLFDYVSAFTGVSYGIGGFGAYVNLTTKYIIEAGAGYGMSLGNAGSVKVGTDFCFSPLNGYNSDDVPVGVTDFFQVYAQYSIGFAENWGFRTKAMFRFVDDSDADAFVESFYIRWDNSVSYDVSDNLGIYAQLRYQAYNLASDADIDNSLSLMAGLSYAFDLK